jgi:phosphoribosyl 1,2-cyclic phosphate phosphodiesterase
MDSTYGVGKSRASKFHMSFLDNIELKEELINRKIADSSTKFIITHLTHNLTESHEKTENIFKGTNIDVAYDGYEIEV